ncbi:MAG: hypothetical protein BWX88_00289 [Planctomycetes bacterium ADurb.Bin126]|nr:MAG: hypothetical protein BWX88_00289 [Planctomycetes bacterium ADurb.Bin126]HOD80806.1 hypothetical protein [Phycisphaerae bacterium]HQL72039.1 hypothetical protein [Phycisphaerae bacterium]
MPTDPAVVDKLEQLAAAIAGYADPRRASDEWKQVYKLLQKTDLPSAQIAGAVGMRDPARLAGAIEAIRTPVEAPPPVEPPNADVCRKAFQAFRKRLELTTLDEESTLGHGPLSKGAGHAVAAIVPPNEWPEPVWQELVRQGKLRHIGRGFYALAK